MTRPPFQSRVRQPGDSPGFMLWKVSNAWQRAIRAVLAPLELTHAQFVLLATATWYGAQREGALTQAQLAELAGVDSMTTSQVVRALEEAGLMQRAVHATDTRARSVSVTRAGNELVRRAVVAVEEADAIFFAPIGTGASAEFLGAMHRLLEPREKAEPAEAAPVRRARRKGRR
jgi:MarR family transcriptional regulator, organic hydroperoxide resistance regulator